MKQIYSTPHKSAIRFVILGCLLCCFTSFATYGQEAINDPLSKPNVWEELKGHPDDSLMWSRYVSKPWACFNKTDRDNINLWKKSLVKALNEVVVEAKTDHVDWAEESTKDVEADEAIEREHERVEGEIKAYIARLEQVLVEERQMIRDLKSNINMNFFIIEELYQEEFAALGVPYEGYMTLYPKGNYNKQEWIEEKEKELYKLKSKNFQKVKKQVLKDARKHQHGNNVD